ncbi:hypothetical protein [Legionella parisiensis]|uniref:Uncharacterized protein n=1 Tax=Legionella parisiensis TaxID=45071 RepID=A0A1E5JTV7_9GAMM|nr:hypothetical protein [Legionella parisiensis]KTD44749.1 hypothetical protein Lpar_0238 [Legionella parisiensis]OEH47498.1 hypothetical protein lpari_01513 [Legionella parisiensis]STX76933.1 Uncharacterised protein [Legionella parisiensis]
MGKDAKEKKAFESASNMRTIYIEQLQKCKSASQFESISSRYEEKKRKNPKTVSFTPYHTEVISGLDLQIKQLTEKLKAQFFSVTPIETSLSAYDREKNDTTDLLPEAHVSDELPHVNQQDLDAQPKAVTEKPLQKEEGGSLTRSLTKQSGVFVTPVDGKPKSRHVTWNEKQLKETEEQQKQHLETYVDQKARRHRNAQLTEVKEKLRTLHTKQTKYDTKAKEYHRKKDQEGEAKYREAAKAAGNIHNQIAKLVDQYIRDGDLDSFKLNSQNILGDDKNNDVKTLRAYRGWWEKFLDDLVELINSGFTRVGSSIRVHELSMFKPATTDGGNKINDISNAINSVKATI